MILWLWRFLFGDNRPAIGAFPNITYRKVERQQFSEDLPEGVSFSITWKVIR